jgi:hypothetical protein
MDVSGHILVSRYIHITDMFYGTDGVRNLYCNLLHSRDIYQPRPGILAHFGP